MCLDYLLHKPRLLKWVLVVLATQYVGSAPTTGQPAPGSAALGQALRIGDPGAPIESPGGGESSRQPVWNLASLRIKDETGSA
jgi:hypothetical protein